MTRVVVTGLGPVSSIGTGANAFSAGLRKGASGVSPIRSFDSTGFPHTVAGEVHDFEPAAILRRLHVADWGRASLFAAAAARLAVEDADLDLDTIDARRVGVVVGTTSGESQEIEVLTRAMVDDGLANLPADRVSRVPAHRLANAVSEELGARGESVTVATACSASNFAIGYALDALASGDADVMVAGGADAVCRWAHAGFYRLGALAAEACRPFDRDRAGIITAEGGAALVMETFDHARARGARILAEVLGFAMNCDANHMVAPEASSIAECMRDAQRRAGIQPDDVDYVSAHGTGTPANDVAEVAALREVFGERLPPISSIKSMLGHTMGAASGFGAIACVIAITEGFLPPTINCVTPDENLRIDAVANIARPARVNVVQNDGFAFGGNNAIVILGRAA